MEIKTTLHPFDIPKNYFLLKITIKELEKKNEPRVIDLDLISYNNFVSKKKSLCYHIQGCTKECL